MPKLTFYHQVRADGGERTGIELDGTTLLHHFQQGHEEHDPALLWFLDLRCEGASLPDEPEAVREWFLKNEAFFVSRLREIADVDLRAGFDAEVMPFEKEVASAPDNARVVVAVSAAGRLVARQIAKDLRNVASDWAMLLSRLAPLSVV
jgi:hypothetical protein